MYVVTAGNKAKSLCLRNIIFKECDFERVKSAVSAN